MSVELHIEWKGETHLVGHLYTAVHSPAVSFEYSPEWRNRGDAFSIDPTSLPLRPGTHHSHTLFGAIHDCGPDRWGRVLIERAVRKHVLQGKPYQDLDYVLALEDFSRIGALRFRANASSPFLAAGSGRLPPLVSLAALNRRPTIFFTAAFQDRMVHPKDQRARLTGDFRNRSSLDDLRAR